MHFSYTLQKVDLYDEQVVMAVPDAQEVKEYYTDNKEAAYWAKVWPASVGLCLFLQEHISLIREKNIIEIAAGLGLVGLYVAPKAAQVHITDIASEAIPYIEASIHHLSLPNTTCAVLDWKHIKELSLPDVVLLSDINYDPSLFEELETVIHFLLEQSVTVIISTPQRLVAKDFINRLLPHVAMQWHTEVTMDNVKTGVSVFVLGV